MSIKHEPAKHVSEPKPPEPKAEPKQKVDEPDLRPYYIKHDGTSPPLEPKPHAISTESHIEKKK